MVWRHAAFQTVGSASVGPGVQPAARPFVQPASQPASQRAMPAGRHAPIDTKCLAFVAVYLAPPRIL